MAAGICFYKIKILRNVFDFIKLLFVIIYFFIKAIFRLILPVEPKSICNDIILVTGGGKGLGKRLVIEFARHRPKHIVICGREAKALEDVASMINANGVACTAIDCDVSRAENIYAMARQIQETIGRVTILVNNAGVVYGLNVLESKEEEIVDAVNVNTLAHIWTLKAFLPAMLQCNHGHVVSINSVIGLIGLAGAAEYCASKYASVAVMESLLQDVSDDLHITDVKVTIVHPYKIQNDMFKGCDTRFPRLFPSVDEGYVAQRTVQAVLTNQHRIILPRLMYLVCWTNTWLPSEVSTAIMRFTGADKAMERFYRRKVS